MLQEIGPYVPFAADVDADDIEVASWKCLNILRALKFVTTPKMFSLF